MWFLSKFSHLQWGESPHKVIMKVKCDTGTVTEAPSQSYNEEQMRKCARQGSLLGRGLPAVTVSIAHHSVSAMNRWD